VQDGDWRAFNPGVRVKLLFIDPQTRRVIALVHMEPGTHLPRDQHLMLEELFVLEGNCHIASDQVLHAGDYFRAEGGSLHGAT
jgi:anti-sigma factor ChrR (cupin superfamily)